MLKDTIESLPKRLREIAKFSYYSAEMVELDAEHTNFRSQLTFVINVGLLFTSMYINNFHILPLETCWKLLQLKAFYICMLGIILSLTGYLISLRMLIFLRQHKQEKLSEQHAEWLFNLENKSSVALKFSSLASIASIIYIAVEIFTKLLMPTIISF